MVPKPHYLLFCDGQSPKVPVDATAEGGSSSAVRGRWRFILEDLEAGTRLEACDAELVQAPERAALLAVVRGLEALEQPSRVTLVTTSRYVSRGLQFGLLEWRESDYCWEHFGSVQPIRNADLWRRIDSAMQFHQINCRWIASQESNITDDFTQLQIEPITDASSAPTQVSSAVPSVLSNDASLLQIIPLMVTDEDDTAVVKEIAAPTDWGWYYASLRILGAPFRSLRLPSLSRLRQSWDGHTLIPKLLNRPTLT